MLSFDVKRKINTLRDILVGKVPDPKAQVEQITIALIYKFMDDIDLQAAELGTSRSFFVGEYEKYAFSQIMLPENSAQDRLNLYAEGIEKMTVNPDLPKFFRDILRNAYIPYRDPETLNRFLKEIAEFTYDNSEDLGNAFEYLLSIMGSQGDAGQFRTPRHIIDMMVEIIVPTKNDSILDPACGTAGFLISAYKYIKKTNQDEQGNSTLTADDMTRMAENFAGYDISPDMVRLSRVNMYLHGFTAPNISEYDTLTSLEKWDDNYDVIFANPPFMTPKGGIIPHNRYRISAKRAEVLFVDYIAEHLNPNGRAAIIVPEGIVFQSQTAYKNLRKFLVDEGYLYGVISLPAGVFNPYSGVKTSILLIDKSFASSQDSILFVKLNNDGYDLGAQRREIKGSEIPDVISVFKDYLNGVDVSDRKNVVFAKKTEIAEQGYITVGDRYAPNNAPVSRWELKELSSVCIDIRNGANVEQLETGKYRVTRIQTISSGTVDLRKTKRTDEEPSELYFMQKGDILLSHINSYEHLAKCAIFPSCDEKVIHGINLIKLRPDGEKIIPEYLCACLKSDTFVAKAKSFAQRAVNQASIKLSDLKSITIPLPPLSVQEEIVAEIEGYQKIIDGARQVVEYYKPTLKISLNWPTERMGDICEIQAGGTPSRNNNVYWDKSDYPWYTSGELNDIYTIDPLNYISQEGLNNSSARLFPKGSLLIGMYDTAAFKMSILDRDATFNQAVCGVKPSPVIDMLFLLLYFTTNRESYLKMRVGARQRNLTKQFISDIVIPIPPLEIQMQIVNDTKKELTIVEQNKQLIKIFEQKIKDKIAGVWGE